MDWKLGDICSSQASVNGSTCNIDDEAYGNGNVQKENNRYLNGDIKRKKYIYIYIHDQCI